MMDGLFTVIPVDGDAIDAGDPYTSSLRYDYLTWDEAVELVRLSFLQGFECIVWKMPDKGGDDGTTESS